MYDKVYFFFFNMFAFGEFEEKYFAFLEGLPGKKEENNNDSFCFGKNTDTYIKCFSFLSDSHGCKSN